jgi:tetratricopeptide (TPR) repeat protein
MHELPENIRRKVVPRWRSLESTSHEELKFSSEFTAPTPLAREVEGLLGEWRRSPNLNNAAELLYAGALGVDVPEIYKAAQYIVESPSCPPGIKRLAAARLRVSVDDAQQQGVRPAKTSFQISRLRKKIGEYPRNALAHVEIARAYVSSGLTDKANIHIRTAIHLAPTSRFVLRAAARFDVHRGDLERSLRALENVAPNDPWIAAAYVSVADLANKTPKRIKPIRNLLDMIDDPAQVSELAAALGTLELKSAGIKKARKYFQRSSIAPNENVVAQLYWLSKNYGVAFDQRLLSDSHAHEAHAQSAAVTQSWPAAIDSCWRWLDDEPFSIRPAYEGGFAASEIMRDFKTAQEFAHHGLRSNPRAAGLMNNLAYALIMDDNLQDGSEYLKRAKQLDVEGREGLILRATEGLLNYRKGDLAEGARLYMETILRAHEQKAHFKMRLAYIHFCYEELRVGHSPPFLSTNQLEDIFLNRAMDKTTRAIFERLLLPMLLARRNYGLIDVEYSGSVPFFENALLSSLPSFDGNDGGHEDDGR